MDIERKKNLTCGTIITLTILLSAALSCFFTMVATSLGELGMHPAIELPNYAWAIWAIAWGGICGYYTGKILCKKLLERRSVLYGMWYGLLDGALIGSINALLTRTFPFGLIIGAILGSILGLIIAIIFYILYKKRAV